MGKEVEESCCRLTETLLGMFLDGLRNTRRILSQDCRSYVRDLKSVPSEQEAKFSSSTSSANADTTRKAGFEPNDNI
jgi:hypothetical protein